MALTVDGGNVGGEGAGGPAMTGVPVASAGDSRGAGTVGRDLGAWMTGDAGSCFGSTGPIVCVLVAGGRAVATNAALRSVATKVAPHVRDPVIVVSPRDVQSPVNAASCRPASDSKARVTAAPSTRLAVHAEPKVPHTIPPGATIVPPTGFSILSGHVSAADADDTGTVEVGARTTNWGGEGCSFRTVSITASSTTPNEMPMLKRITSRRRRRLGGVTCVLPVVIDVADVRVRQRGKCSGLAVEPVAGLGIEIVARRDDLDGDDAIEARVLRLVDIAHRPGADGGEDFVPFQTRAGFQRHHEGVMIRESSLAERPTMRGVAARYLDLTPEVGSPRHGRPWMGYDADSSYSNHERNGSVAQWSAAYERRRDAQHPSVMENRFLEAH